MRRRGILNWRLFLKGWDTFYQYPGRGGRQTVVTEGGVEDEILERTEGWEVDVLVTAID